MTDIPSLAMKTMHSPPGYPSTISSQFVFLGVALMVLILSQASVRAQAPQAPATVSARWPSPGTLDGSFQPSVEQFPLAAAAAPQADGKAVVGLASQTPSQNLLLRLNPDGTRDLDYNPAVGGFVGSITVLDDGGTIIGGVFTLGGAFLPLALARLDSDGDLDPTFDVAVSGSNLSYRGVQTTILQPDGKLMIGGAFETVGGIERRGLARIDLDGSVDQEFHPRIASEEGVPTVNTLARQADGKVLVGGAFDSIDGVGRGNLARLRADGSLDLDFNPEISGGGEFGGVYSLREQPDGKILIGGAFDLVGGTARRHLARVHPDGTLDTDFAPEIADMTGGNPAGVFTFGLQTDGKILIGGSFESVGGIARSALARLNPDGTVDVGFNAALSGGNAAPVLTSVIVQADGAILIGGRFAAVGQQPRATLARLHNDAAPQELSVSAQERIQWLRGGASPEVGSVTFDLSVDAGANWTRLGAGVRMPGGWELTGLELPSNGLIRARARVQDGGASSGIVQATREIGSADGCIFVASNSVSFESGGGNKVVAVTADDPDCEWSVQNPCPDWITVTPSSGAGSGQITIEIKPNSTGPGRSCELIIAGRSLTVFQAQAGCAFAVSESGANFGADFGNKVVAVTADRPECEWSVQNPCPDWVTVSGANGSGSGQVTIYVSSNRATAPRSCELTIAGHSFPVSQSCAVTLSRSSHSFEAGGGSAIVSVTGSGPNCPWEVLNPCADWLKVSPANGSGSGEITIEVSPNLTSFRSCALTIAGSSVFISQPACGFTLTTTNASFGLSGGEKVVEVVGTSNGCSWTVENPCPDWVTVSPTGGTTSEEIAITVSANPTGASRACELTVAGQPLLVSQSAIGRLPFRLFATTASAPGQIPSLIELHTDPVSESVVESLGQTYAKIDFAPDNRLYSETAEQLYPPDDPPQSDSGKPRERGSRGITIGTSALVPDGIAFSPDGTLYASDADPFFRPPTRFLYSVDLQTREATEVGRETNANATGTIENPPPGERGGGRRPPGGQPANLPPWAIDFAPNGRLFGAFLDLGETDPVTGQVVAMIGSLPVSSGLTDIDFAPDEFIYGVASRTLYRINPATAATEVVGVYNWDLRGIASEPSLAPTIQVSSSADGIVISWPASASEFNLRYAPELRPATWTAVSAPPTQVGNQMVVTIPFADKSQFFQLQSQ